MELRGVTTLSHVVTGRINGRGGSMMTTGTFFPFPLISSIDIILIYLNIIVTLTPYGITDFN